MLFKFGKFWKTLSLVVGSWIFYGIFGFEFTAITFLSLIVAVHLNETEKLCLEAGRTIENDIYKPVWQFDGKWTCIKKSSQ